jgi:hypothetical protein
MPLAPVGLKSPPQSGPTLFGPMLGEVVGLPVQNVEVGLTGLPSDPNGYGVVSTQHGLPADGDPGDGAVAAVSDDGAGDEGDDSVTVCAH